MPSAKEFLRKHAAEKAKEKAAAKRPEPEAPPAVAPKNPPRPAPTLPAKAAPPKPVKVPKPIPVVFQCGHPIPPDAPDPRNIAGAKCPSCIAESRRAKAARKAGKVDTQRWPHMAVFNSIYDAEKVLHTGTLTLTDGTVFSAYASGVTRLMRELGLKCSAHCAKNSVDKTAATS
jgi:hypothetical protein